MNKKSSNQRRHNLCVFRQLCNCIPTFLVPRLAAETGVNKLCRKFSAWSHVVAMLYTQLTHCIGLNDLCDSLQLHSGPLSVIRGATAPKRNTLSHANARRDAGLAEKLFWSVLEHLGNLQPKFTGGKRQRVLRRRDPAARPQIQGGLSRSAPVANLDRAAVVCAAALSGLPERLALRLHA